MAEVKIVLMMDPDEAHALIEYLDDSSSDAVRGIVSRLRALLLAC
jgi:hypothetical protein